MFPQMGRPGTKTWEYSADDNSCINEFNDFMDSVRNNNSLNGDLSDAYEVLKIIGRIYKKRLNK